MVAQIARLGGYALRGLKATPALLFTENGAKALVKGVHTGLKTGTGKVAIINGLKTGGKALEGVAKAGVWSSIKAGVKSLPGAVSKGWQVGARAAAIKGTSPLLGKLAGAFKGATKAIPGLGNIAMAAFALPTIFSAFKDEGIVGGVKEIAKEGTKLGAGAIGAAIGSAFGPIGSAIGWIGGSLIGGLFTGKSHSEKKAEQEQQEQLLAQQQAQNQAVYEAMAQNIAGRSGYMYANPFEQAGFSAIG